MHTSGSMFQDSLVCHMLCRTGRYYFTPPPLQCPVTCYFDPLGENSERNPDF